MVYEGPSPEPLPTPVPTQVKRPKRAIARTIFQAFVGICSMWALIVAAAGVDNRWAWVGTSLAVTGAVTRVMALPGVEKWLQQYFPWLAAEDPKGEVR